MHWAADYMPDVRDRAGENGWSVDEPQSESGPLVLTHEDGSELSMISSSVTGGFAVEYDASEDATEAVTDTHVSFQDKGNGFEWFFHVLERHAEKN